MSRAVHLWRRVSRFVRDLVAQPCASCCAAPADVCVACATDAARPVLDGASALWCQNCGSLFAAGPTCPRCASLNYWPLEAVVQDPKRRQRVRRENRRASGKETS